MSNPELVAYWIPCFLRDHLLLERNLSKNTQKGYRDSLRLLLVYLSKKYHRPIDALALDDISPERKQSTGMNVNHLCLLTVNRVVHVRKEYELCGDAVPK